MAQEERRHLEVMPEQISHEYLSLGDLAARYQWGDDMMLLADLRACKELLQEALYALENHHAASIGNLDKRIRAVPGVCRPVKETPCTLPINHDAYT